MKQLFANNAKTTLASGITAASTSLSVVDGSTFPTPAAFEYFLVTVEVGSSVEIVMITSRVGNTLTIGGLLYSGETVPGRGQEGTISKTFAAGARVECRTTKGTLSQYTKTFTQIGGVDQLVAPKNAYQDGYVSSTVDPFGTPAITVVKDPNTWRFLTYTPILTLTVSGSNTTTTVAASAVSLSLVTTGKYLVQFLSGTYAGQVRAVTACAGNIVTWGVALAGPPAIGDTFEVLKANASILADVQLITDDAIVFPLILSGDS